MFDGVARVGWMEVWYYQMPSMSAASHLFYLHTRRNVLGLACYDYVITGQ